MLASTRHLLPLYQSLSLCLKWSRRGIKRWTISLVGIATGMSCRHQSGYPWHAHVRPDSSLRRTASVALPQIESRTLPPQSNSLLVLRKRFQHGPSTFAHFQVPSVIRIREHLPYNATAGARRMHMQHASLTTKSRLEGPDVGSSVARRKDLTAHASTAKG